MKGLANLINVISALGMVLKPAVESEITLEQGAIFLLLVLFGMYLMLGCMRKMEQWMRSCTP